MDLFQELQGLHRKPLPFESYTRLELWNDAHLSKGMLEFHLDPTTDAASRNHAFIDRSVRWILADFGIGAGSAVIDFGCGPGLYTLPLAEAGAEVTGVDFSERSIAYARETARAKGLKIDYVLQNYLEFETERRFDLITMIWCDYSALSPNQRKGLLCKWHDLLTDQGSILIDVDSMVRFGQAPDNAVEYTFHPQSGFFSPGPHHVFSISHKYEAEQLLLRKDTMVDETRTLELYDWAQCFSRESLEAEFAASGLEITAWYSDVAGSPFDAGSPVLAAVARRVPS